ncbi:MAG: hypothetical protein KDD51_07890 [Bdellovibrionales bacterium]|nr:hypothetical protein [Bdellovibrionales bacterium]
MVCDRFAVVTDRGGHLHNAVMLLRQMGLVPQHLVTTYGPDVASMGQFSELKGTERHWVPYLFSWAGKRRYLNPVKSVLHIFVSLVCAWRTRPRVVVSVGATNVVFYCYWARLFGARVYHVECMNQVYSKSVTGKLLYPIAEKVFVQWPELLKLYGKKAEYAGWVL